MYRSTMTPAARGIDPRFIEQLEQQFGFDKPTHERFIGMMADYLTFDFAALKTGR